MKLKLIALDIDGTLTNDEKKITADTLSTLLKFQEQGIRVMLASARPVPGLYSAASELRLGDHHGIQRRKSRRRHRRTTSFTNPYGP